ncbi:Uncharacterized protein Rs2_03500 [Raphanus sativus]|nr:Uncharacterized protein Rs2_03500 [Raphanus sativus]
MSHRYSRADKGKGREDDFPLRKPLVKVPATNVTELIERNKLTLIGKVTNPAIQKPKALVDFFLQQWNVVGKNSGRNLGPALFQFGFESEKDLQTILSKAPFHFKNWMLILQRWEPIVSDSFPSQIPFWISAHGIPLHYWTDETIEAIGAALGPIVNREVDKARLKVSVNGLKPLIMKVDLQLPSSKVIEVELEYERIGKHCFCCKALDHEDTEKHPCPFSRLQDRGSLGISQHNALEKIENSRRRQHERRFSRQQNPPAQREARWTNARNAPRRSEVSSRGYSSRSESEKCSGFEENKRRYDDRNGSYHTSPSRRAPHHRPSEERISPSWRARSQQNRELEIATLPQGSQTTPPRECNTPPRSIRNLQQLLYLMNHHLLVMER